MLKKEVIPSPDHPTKVKTKVRGTNAFLVYRNEVINDLKGTDEYENLKGKEKAIYASRIAGSQWQKMSED